MAKSTTDPTPRPMLEWSMLPGKIVRVRTQGRGGRMTAELSAQLQEELGRLYAWIQQQFRGGPWREVVVLENMQMVLDDEAAQIAQGGISFSETLNVARAAYVVESATMRLQFTRIFREQKMQDRLRTFATEAEGLAFVRAK